MKSDHFLTLAQQRYSVREFSDRPVETAVLDKILLAGQAAPTACNFQPQQIFVLRSKEALEKLGHCTRRRFQMPLALLVCYDKTKSWKRSFDGQDSGWADASIVATHMMLEAWEQGVGSTWVMHFDPEAVRTAFQLQPETEPVALLVMGYPSETAVPSPMHAETKPLEAVVTYL